ncbi:MAG TPA: SMC-Scp complex subunit ScpB [Candidatus Angelobacter sp.]|nr:SMC-Scp complex subunit ScpB [Candidatus Angelobacter sp.]
MSLKAQLEALIYAAEDPITLDQMAALLKEDLLALKSAMQAEQEQQQLQQDQPQQEPLSHSDETPHPEEAENHLGAVETAESTPPAKPARDKKEKSEKAELRGLLKPFLEELIADYSNPDHGIEIREVASGYRMSTKPEHHDVVRGFSKSLKPPIRLSLQALETLAVIAYKQPITVPEISDIRGVDAGGVIGTLLERKLITTAGRKAVVGRPMLYKTTKDFLLRFGLKDIHELPSLEEFEKLAAGEMQEELFTPGEAIADATGTPGESMEAKQMEEKQVESKQEDGGVEQMEEDKAEVPQNVTEPTVSSDPEHNKADEQVADQIASESTGG